MIGALFRSPSSFERDPKGFFRNQGGHMVFVGLPIGALALLWAAVTGFSVWPVVALLLGVYAAWEVLQHVLYDAEAWDCVENFAFVACGALAVALLSPTLALIGALFLWSGWLRRAGL
ncbi:MAG: hypothetical protein ACK41Y_06035 [Paracoccus hibiscisoli]|uniref:hypothetical protein n=1 Tax=Paracoccus hibiscisoli TaxID=2023261 RepID=UPI00391ABA47